MGINNKKLRVLTCWKFQLRSIILLSMLKNARSYIYLVHECRSYVKVLAAGEENFGLNKDILQSFTYLK